MQNVQIREVFQIGEVSNKRGFTVIIIRRIRIRRRGRRRRRRRRRRRKR